MSYPNHSYPSERELLIEDLAKAFREVTRLCKEFIDKQKPLSLRQPPLSLRQPSLSLRQPPLSLRQTTSSLSRRQTPTQPKHHINFNNYKGNFEPKTNLAQTIASFDVDADSSQQDSTPQLQHPSNRSKDISKIIKGQIKPSTPVKSSNPPNQGKSSNPSNQVKSSIPPPPKAPLSPYFIFYKEKKDVIKGEFPEMSVTEITTAAGKVWKSLTEEEKEPFTGRFFEEKEKYEKQMKAYVKKYPNYKEVFKKVGSGSNNGSKK